MDARKTPWWLLCLVLLFLLVRTACGQQWRASSTPKHHQAVVRVSSDTKNCGSGTCRVQTQVGCGVYCRHKNLLGVLTVAHALKDEDGTVVDSDRATVVFSDGTQKTASFSVDKYGHDVGFVFAAHPTIKPLEIADSPPGVGERVEWITRNGSRVRSTIAEVASDWAWYANPIVSGDSGVPVFNVRGEIVGVQAVVETDVASPRSGSASYQHMCAFLRRLSGKYQRTPAPLPTPPAPPTPPVKIDYNKLAAMVYAKIEANADKFRGPPGIPGTPGLAGNDGAPGKDGKDGTSPDYDKLAAEVVKRLPTVVLEIHHPDGQVFRQSRPLGEPIRLRLSPR